MNSSDNRHKLDEPERSALVQQVVDECLQRRSSGERLSDQQVIASHRDLMPELELELRKLALVEHARRHAADADARSTEHLPDQADDSAAELPDSFPGCEVVREIHRGGQAVVYQAIQTSTKRKVAVKVLHGGPYADARGRARLQREIQILGQLNHPGIVRVHDSGTAAGCLYYVMDYISGEALDAFVMNNRLSVDETLGLLVKICEAVNAAHLRGVIHRDLKPSNIRVDANGQPHVLDFGLAKVVLDAVTEGGRPALMSMTGQFIGSLPWASPEQAAGQPEQIDLRTDVYSLGVTLYQALTDKFPYEVVGSVHDVLDNILKAEPVRPRTIRREINDEVETIVLKCLDKQRARRYQSAGELARDIRHYLAGEPIEAKRDSTLYVLTKTLRRYRVPLAVGAVFLVLVIGFAVTMTLMYRQAERQGRKAELMAGFLDEVLTSADPVVAQGPELTVREMLAEAAAKIGQLAEDPEVAARIHHTIGRAYLHLGAHAAAEEHLSAALAIREELFGDEHLAVAEALNDLGELFRTRRDYERAEGLLRRALGLRRRLGAGQRLIATSMSDLGSLLRETGALAEAEPLLRDALDIRRRLCGDEHPDTVVSMNRLALLLRCQRKTAAARELFEQALALRRKVLGDRHPYVASNLNNLALILYDEGNYDEARRYFEQALDLWRDRFDPEHSYVVQTIVNLAKTLQQQGDWRAALRLCQDELEILSPDHAQRVDLLFVLGQLHLDQGAAQTAEPLLRDVCAAYTDTFGADHPATLAAEGKLAECLSALGRLDQVEGPPAKDDPLPNDERP